MYLNMWKKNGFDFPKAVLDQCNFNEW